MLKMGSRFRGNDGTEIIWNNGTEKGMTAQIIKTMAQKKYGMKASGNVWRQGK
jgi:hypothetical protein